MGNTTQQAQPQTNRSTATKETEKQPASLSSEGLAGVRAAAPPMPPPPPSSNVAQRSEMDEEEIQMKSAEPGSFGKTTAQLKGNGDIKAQMGASFGADFSNVNFHTNSTKASNIGAQAYTQGSDVHFAPGRFNPSSTQGKELIGHELSHVVQQREGRVQATTQAKGLPVNDDAGLEKEADTQGAIAARGGTVQRKAVAGTSATPFAAQLKVIQMEGGASVPAPQEEAPIAESDEAESQEEAGNEQDVPIPPFPTVSADNAGPQEQAPPLPPRPQYNRRVPSRPPPTQRPTNLRPPGPAPLPPPLPPRPQSQAVPPPSQTPPPLPRRINPYNSKRSLQSGAARENYNADTNQDYTEYGILGSGGAAAAASATTKGLQYGDTLRQGAYDWGTALQGATPEASKFGETASAVSSLGVIGGALGTAGAIADGVRAGQYMANKDKVASDRVMGGGGALLSAGGSALKESSTLAYHSATLAGDAAAAGGAAAMAGIGSVAMGSADVIRGAYGAIRADQRGDKLRGQAEWTENQDVYSAATQAASTQDMRKAHAKGTVFKGLLLVGGGAALILMGANPIGWGLLAGAAIVGGIIALRRFLQKRARKKDVAIRELGVTADYEKYLAAKKTHSMFNRQKKVAIPENPLDREMKKRGYTPKDYGKFYADYIHDTAWVLYNCGVMGDQSHGVNQEMRNIIINMGLKVVDRESPKPEAIAKNLHT